MFITLALLILGCAIIVMFSQEFGNFFKKIFAIWGVKLLAPLLLLTFLIVYYQPWVFWGLMQIKLFLHQLIILLASWFPFQTGALPLAAFAVIMILTLLPVLLIDSWVKRKTYHSFQYAYFMSALIWLFLVVLLTISYVFF